MNYPPGETGGITRETVEFRCPVCGARWDADMHCHLGQWYFDVDEEAFCPDGCEGVGGEPVEGEEI